jgi:hypothetical protein
MTLECRFYYPSSVSRIREVIADVVRYEDPISFRLACRRVAAHWGFRQIRGQVMERVQALLPGDEVRVHTSDAGIFLIPTETSAFRAPAPNRSEMPRTWPLRRLRTQRSSSYDSISVLPRRSSHKKLGVSSDSSERAGGSRAECVQESRC